MNRAIHCRLALVILALMVLGAAGWAVAQTSMQQPQASPKAVVSQTIGISEVTVTYHRPGVKGRTIWGGLVPYGQLWRVGANENTTVSFSDPVKINGKDLPAGTYGLHMIPGQTEWTVIFSRNYSSWGSYFYNQSEDALRLTVTPQPAEPMEWLAFEFGDLTNTSGTLALHWEKLRVPLALTFDTDALVVAHARNEFLRSNAAFSWQGYNQAASYCLRRGINLDEALGWANKSITYNENFANTSTKAALLEKLGRADEAKKARERAEAVAVSEQDVNSLGYQYLQAKQFKEAIALFKKNAKEHPASMNVYDSLAEAYAQTGETKLAVENYNKALSLAPDEDAKIRIRGELQKLQGK